VTVTTGSWCSWTAASNDSWLTVGTSAGTGSGPVAISVPVNNGAERTGTATIAGQTYTATQLGTSMPSGWAHQDVGVVGVAGDSTFNGTTYSVTGGGADVWGTADAFQYVYRSLTGDGSITARVTAVQNVNAWTKAGVMIRETLDPGSANAFLLVSASKGLSFQRRASAGGTTVNTAGPLSGAPYWIRLDRIGNSITAYQSPDGVVWTLLGTDTVAMQTTVLIGLAVSSHTTTAAATGAFENVSVTVGTPVSPTPWMHKDIGAVGIAGTASFNTSTSLYTVKGAGADAWGSADAFHYLYRPMTGDGVIVARVASVQNINSWTKAGVMIRETLDPASANAFMLVSYSKGLSYQRRTVAGGVTVNTAGGLNAAPYWVKLERLGSTFNAYASADGASWTLVGSDAISMASTVYVGLAVTSHNTSAAASATFDSVTAP
jgi:regulation of enolase protein 1 (concanavalin A-like superfamily)